VKKEETTVDDVENLDLLAPKQLTARDKLALRGEGITAEEPCHRKVTSRTQPSEEKEGGCTVRLSGTNSLKAGAV
jgi:hypothetical protein